MKSAVFLLFLSVFIVAVTCLPASDDEGTYQPGLPWYNSYSQFYMMCRLKCRQSCLDQGYWRGACKQGACYCFGPMTPYGNGFPMPVY